MSRTKADLMVPNPIAPFSDAGAAPEQLHEPAPAKADELAPTKADELAPAKLRTITISDPFVRKILTPTLVAIFALYLIATLAILFVLADSAILPIDGFGLFDGVISPLSRELTDIFMGLSNVPDAIKWPIGSLLPAVTTAICFKAIGKELNRLGQVLLIMTVCLAAGCTAGLWSIPSQDSSDIYDGADALAVFQAFMSFGLGTGLTYLGLLAGFSVATEQNPG